MDRRQVSGNVPAELAERISDQGEGADPEDFKEQAKADLVDGVMSHPNGYRGVRLWHILQSWLNCDGREFDERLSVLSHHLHGIFNGHAKDRDALFADRLVLARSDAESWLRIIVAQELPQRVIDDMAEELASEDDEVPA